MKKYTSEEVIDLVGEYMGDEIIDKVVSSFNLDQTIPFGAWLAAKEQSEIPIHGQMIWVTDVINNKREWVKAKFIKFSPLDFKKVQVYYMNHILYFDEYSITDPN